MNPTTQRPPTYDRMILDLFKRREMHRTGITITQLRDDGTLANGHDYKVTVIAEYRNYRFTGNGYAAQQAAHRCLEDLESTYSLMGKPIELDPLIEKLSELKSEYPNMFEPGYHDYSQS